MYQVNFLPWRQQKISHKKRLFLSLLFSQIILLITAGIFLYALQQSEYQQLLLARQDIQNKYQQSQMIISTINHKQNQLSQLIKQNHLIEIKTKNSLSRLKLLRSIPNIVPPKSWLSSFAILGEKVEIRANSYSFQDISQLIPHLDKTPLIHTIKLTNMGRTKDIHYLHLGAYHLGDIHE